MAPPYGGHAAVAPMHMLPPTIPEMPADMPPLPRPTQARRQAPSPLAAAAAQSVRPLPNRTRNPGLRRPWFHRRRQPQRPNQYQEPYQGEQQYPPRRIDVANTNGSSQGIYDAPRSSPDDVGSPRNSDASVSIFATVDQLPFDDLYPADSTEERRHPQVCLSENGMVGSQLDLSQLVIRLGDARVRVAGGDALGELYGGLYAKSPVMVRCVRLPTPPKNGDHVEYERHCSVLRDFARNARRVEQVKHPAIAHLLGVAAPGEAGLAATDPRLHGPYPCALVVFDCYQSLLRMFLDDLRKTRINFENPSSTSFYGYHNERASQPVVDDDRAQYVARLRIALQIAAGFKTLHGHYIPHRDFSTSKVVLTAEVDANTGTLPEFAQAKIKDIGMVLPPSVLQDASLMSSASLSTITSSAFQYLSPEADIIDYMDVKAAMASDIYAFGVVLYEILTLQRPWACRDMMEVRRAVCQLRQRPEWPESGPFVETSLRVFVESMWHHDPILRPDASTVHQAIADAYAAALAQARTIAGNNRRMSNGNTSIHASEGSDAKPVTLDEDIQIVDLDSFDRHDSSSPNLLSCDNLEDQERDPEEAYTCPDRSGDVGGDNNDIVGRFVVNHNDQHAVSLGQVCYDANTASTLPHQAERTSASNTGDLSTRQDEEQIEDEVNSSHDNHEIRDRTLLGQIGPAGLFSPLTTDTECRGENAEISSVGNDIDRSEPRNENHHAIDWPSEPPLDRLARNFSVHADAGESLRDTVLEEGNRRACLQQISPDTGEVFQQQDDTQLQGTQQDALADQPLRGPLDRLQDRPLPDFQGSRSTIDGSGQRLNLSGSLASDEGMNQLAADVAVHAFDKDTGGHDHNLDFLQKSGRSVASSQLSGSVSLTQTWSPGNGDTIENGSLRRKKTKQLKELLERITDIYRELQRRDEEEHENPPNRQLRRARAIAAEADSRAQDEDYINRIRTADEDMDHELILQIMRERRNSKRVLCVAIMALCNIARDDFKVHEAFEDGAIDELVAAVYAQESNAEVCALFCRAIKAFAGWYIAEIGHSMRALGVPATIVSVLEKHGQNSSVQLSGCQALLAICGASELSRVACVAAGAPAVVSKVMSRNLAEWKNVELIKASLQAFTRLADGSPDGTQDLLKICCLDSVCRACDVFANDGIEYHVLEALEAVVEFEEGCELIVQTRGIHALASTMLRENSNDFVRRCCRIVTRTCSLRKESCESEMIASNITERIVRVLQSVSTTEGLHAAQNGDSSAVAAAECITALASFGDRIQTHCRIIGAIEMVIIAWKARFNKPTCVAAFAKCAENLLKNNQESLLCAEGFNLPGLLLRSSEKHKSDALTIQAIRSVEALFRGRQANADSRPSGARKSTTGAPGQSSLNYEQHSYVHARQMRKWSEFWKR